MALRLAGGRDVFSTAFLFVLLQWPPNIVKSLKYVVRESLSHPTSTRTDQILLARPALRRHKGVTQNLLSETIKI